MPYAHLPLLPCHKRWFYKGGNKEDKVEVSKFERNSKNPTIWKASKIDNEVYFFEKSRIGKIQTIKKVSKK